MAKKSKGVVAAAAAFAASPQGRRLLAQAKDYASRPENQEKAKRLVAQARAKAASRRTTPSTKVAPATGDGTQVHGGPVYGTPPSRP
jgi:hypothetical protein